MGEAMCGRFLSIAWAFLVCGAAAPAMSVQVMADETPIKIGVIADMSGIYQGNSGKGAAVAVELAVEDMGGKVLGRPIQVLTADHQDKPDIAGTIARRWYDQDGVHAIVDVVSSGTSLAVAAAPMRRSVCSWRATPRAPPSTWRSAILTPCNGAATLSPPPKP
jgi:branched-chain amino acid transport system substrate-binding protein